MTHRDMPTDWTLTDVREDERQLLDRLMQLYCYDFSEFDPDDVGEDGRFDSVSLDRYGREPGYHAFLLRVRGRPAGFALVDEQSPLPQCAPALRPRILRAPRLPPWRLWPGDGVGGLRP